MIPTASRPTAIPTGGSTFGVPTGDSYVQLQKLNQDIAAREQAQLNAQTKQAIEGFKTLVADVKNTISNVLQAHGGGKNAAHANQKAREAAQARYNEVKKQYDQLKSKPNKTKEDKEQLDKLEKQVKHEKQKMDNTGENHSRKAKGSN